MSFKFIKKMFGFSLNNEQERDDKQKPKTASSGSVNKLSNLYMERATLKMATGSHKDALSDYDSAIANDPSNILAYYARAKLKLILNNIKGADQDAAIANKLHEDFDKGIKESAKGDICYDSNDFLGAIRHWDKSFELNPHLITNYYFRGHCKKSIGDLDGACEDFSTAIETSAENMANAHYDRALIKETMNDLDGAICDLDRAIEIDPNNSDYFFRRSRFVGDIEGIEDLNEAISLSPSNQDLYLSRALKKTTVKDNTGSVVDFERYIELNTDNEGLISNAEAYCVMAGIKDIMKDLEGALACYDTAITLDDKYAPAYYERGELRRVMGMEELGLVDQMIADHLDGVSRN